MRSRTAQDYFRVQKLGQDYEFKSCGVDIKKIEKNKDGLCKLSVPISQELCEWADIILVMENDHASFIKEKYGYGMREKTVVLGIPDIYDYMQPELCMILNQKVKFGLEK